MEPSKPMAEEFKETPPPEPAQRNQAASLPRTQAEIEAAQARYNATPSPVVEDNPDPLSPVYARTDIDETPGTVLHFWFGYAAERPGLIAEREAMWFRNSFDTDRAIAHRFADLVAKLASGEARRWAKAGTRERLAAVIALDQFSRNIFRNEAGAFENDALALELAKEGLSAGEDMNLRPIERWFLYMPLEHSESASDQRRSVEKFEALLAEAPPEARDIFESALDYAKRHAAIIRRFGRFPHRNAILKRTSTSAERIFLSKPGSSF